MDFKKKYKEETGKSVNGTIVNRLIHLQYSDDYVNWLEQQLRLHIVSCSSDGCYECNSNNLRPKEYNCLDCGHDGYCY
ncbi:hypothetical protein [Tenacibaculum finnmarkense]|uniref:hypothetical protein n=1 Tax=Tenacibaculum finnmarkense TaxID=2781243 RepID=UPI00187B9F92|nr:hypothetical protein [Tenacibaculum finnmarkense]MBE7649144.1 hypothetical protein [Tenacibaculum finnmarkense genomovar ulcerans]